MTGAIRIPEEMPLLLSSATASSRARGLGLCGSVARQAVSSRVGTERFTWTFTFSFMRLKISRSERTSGDLVRTETGLPASSRASSTSRVSR